ncbi:MAG: 50S ribosome-binding GTPase [Phycisphaerales bacterium]|nr:50S ribosome-binding GTPase [Phycisphaerales bacterium]
MTTSTAMCLTANAPGAVAIIEVCGAVHTAMQQAQCPLPDVGGLQLHTIPDLDDVLLARIDEHTLHIMPHGGRHVVRRVLHWLADHGVSLDSASSHATWPSAQEHEHNMLAALPLARTSLALELLLAQPSRWQDWDGTWTPADDARCARLDRLLHPPLVVLAGPPNIGKSTLLNALAGRTRALVDDAPGTTRDHVGAAIDLEGLIVHWVDTPGLRESDDLIEEAAIQVAQDPLARADFLIAAADATTQWPELPRTADLRLAMRSDLGQRSDADGQCAAAIGDGLEEVVQLIRDALVPEADRTSTRPWKVNAG